MVESGGQGMKTTPEALKDLYVAMGNSADAVADLNQNVDVLNAFAEAYQGSGDAGTIPEAIENITAVAENIGGGDVISGDVIFKIREPKTDIDFASNGNFYQKTEEVIIKNIGGTAMIQGYLCFERIIVDAPLSIPNGGFAAFDSNSYNYETRYLYLSDKIVSMEDYAFSSTRIKGNVVVDCGFSEDKFPTAMAKAVALGIEVNYNIPEPRSIE